MSRILTSGAVVNFVLVIIGALVGLLLKRGIPQRVRDTLMKGMSLCVLFIGVKGLFEDNINILIVIISTAVGAVIGELADFDRMINRLGDTIEKKFSRSGESKIAEGFVTTTLLFCVGAMTVVGSIDSGISGDNMTLYSKSVIDGISAAVFASALGAGVLISAVSVLFIEGGLTLLAFALEPILSDRLVAHMSVIGSLLIVAISLNLMGLTKIKVMNLLPAVFIPVILCLFM